MKKKVSVRIDEISKINRKIDDKKGDTPTNDQNIFIWSMP